MPHCPVCIEPLVMVEEADVTAYACPKCHGTWIGAQALQRRTHLETDPNQPHLTLPPLTELADTVSRSNSTKILNCFDCRQPMSKEQFNTKIPVQIDRCDTCNFIWLDPGEQGLLIDLYKELVASQPHPAPVQQQKLDRIQQLRPQPTATYTSTSSSGVDGYQVATNVGFAVLEILVDLLFSSSNSRHRRW